MGAGTYSHCCAQNQLSQLQYSSMSCTPTRRLRSATSESRLRTRHGTAQSVEPSHEIHSVEPSHEIELHPLSECSVAMRQHLSSSTHHQMSSSSNPTERPAPPQSRTPLLSPPLSRPSPFSCLASDQQLAPSAPSVAQGHAPHGGPGLRARLEPHIAASPLELGSGSGSGWPRLVPHIAALANSKTWRQPRLPLATPDKSSRACGRTAATSSAGPT